MQTPFHKFFLSIILSYSICCSLEGHAADITVPQGIYDGETLTAPFPYTVIGDPRGTTVVPAGNLILKNLDNSIAALPLSCFGNLLGNFTIDGNGYSLTFENIRTATNGAALSNSGGSGLFIVQDFDELLFSNCNSLLSALPQAGQQTTTPTPSSGTIFSKSDLILKNIQNFSFYSNLVSGDGGAIDAQSLTIQGVKKLCVFQENTAQSDGGACQVTKNFLATDNPAPVAFVGNVAGIKGGGVAAVTNGQNGQTPGAGAAPDLSVSFSKNTAVEFDGNVARIGGGIYSDGPISFLENAKTVFLNNEASPVYIDPSPPQGGGGGQPAANYGDGGAIFCKNGAQQQGGTATSGEVSFKGEGMVFFSKNIAAGKGGAIYAKKLSISDCGPVQFIGNIANDGGAIYLADSGELSLSADRGDIIFDANLKRTAQQTATTVNDVQVASNAISMAAGGTVSALRASEGHQILFNDPIVMANGQNQAPAQTQPLKINDGEGYSGDIVFAKGESVLYSDIELVQGKILLRDKAKLLVRSLDQTGGVVYMEAGTTLDFVNGAQQPQQPPAKPISISLTNLHLSLASLLESSGVTNPPATQTPAPAVIGNANNGSAVTIAGPIFFEDLDNTSYDKYEWLGANQTLDVLKLQMGAQPPAQAPADLTLGSENPQYGYQGKWELRWEPAQAPQNNIYTLKATWTKTGYNPGPERVASLVPNSLWGSIFDVRSAHSAIQASIDGRAYCRGLWISGISNFFYHDRDALGQGYRHISGGYAIGANSYFGASMFGVAFSEMFGRSKDYVVCRSNDHTCIGTVYLATKKALCGSFVFGETFMRASYGFGNQHMKTSYTFAEENDVRWDNNCLVGEIGAGLPIVIAPSKLYLNELHPFVQAEFAYADHESFTEEGDQAREFKSGHLMNLTIPVGVKFDRCSSKHPNKYSFMGAYICDAYRSISGTKTTLLSHQESWTTDAFHLGRHGAMVRGSMYASLTNNIEVYGHGRYEYRNASRGYGLSVGSKVRF
ncbi:polymorphic outer membrane protein middle domain-containing protein [Chlamydia suis]|uniref:polymorphic outer membrane protein middle domain-containing protein n=1 Tax=Chlamydia suis TaxID=83559 RepID=UPI0009B04D83|nr:polymorphic outer membrane protein middle domain-containing protein [Chlamydia suis]